MTAKKPFPSQAPIRICLKAWINK